LLRGKTEARVVRPQEGNLLIVFTDGTRLFADADAPLEVSITG
jgi:hypothetical protein